VTGSRSTAKDLVRFYPRSRGRIDVIAYAASRKLRPPEEDVVQAFRAKHGLADVTVGYLGTIQPRKNVDMLADAFAAAAGDRPWQLLLAGRMRPGYRPRCLDRGDPRCRYLGELADDEIAPYLASLSCMVSPSSYEGFGLTFIEAMAVGCPVIGVANSSVPEVVGDAGLLIESAEIGALADAIRRIVRDPRGAAELSRRGVERAALFSWSHTARGMLDVYRRACEGASSDA
jgi:glycosyltransferase involved in cell wall biosynthesis